jgi:hypothetical protein
MKGNILKHASGKQVSVTVSCYRCPQSDSGGGFWFFDISGYFLESARRQQFYRLGCLDNSSAVADIHIGREKPSVFFFIRPCYHAFDAIEHEAFPEKRVKLWLLELSILLIAGDFIGH